MGWKLSDIENLHTAGKIKGFKVLGQNTEQPAAAKLKKIKKVPVGLAFIKRQLDINNIPFVTEYYFAKPRMFRFDIALPVLKIAFEYEGIGSAKSRHTSITGYTRDATKYNIAAAKGWRVYRYTALNYKNFESDLKAII